MFLFWKEMSKKNILTYNNVTAYEFHSIAAVFIIFIYFDINKRKKIMLPNGNSKCNKKQK
jgi:hypothetical protein